MKMNNRKAETNFFALVVFFLLLTAGMLPFNNLQADNYCLDFDGVNDFVEVNKVLPDTGTIELWYYPENFYNFNSILDNSTDPNDWEMWIYNTGILRFRVDDGDVSCDLNSLNGPMDWYHIAISWKKRNTFVDYYLYVNGELKDSNINGNWIDPGSSFYFGGGNGNTAGDGQIDEARIWNITRTHNEINDNMYNSLTGSETGLVSYYKFNEGSGMIAGDSSGNGYDGTLQNMDNTAWVASALFLYNSLLPENNSSSISTDTDLNITFDKNVTAGIGNIIIKNSLDDSIVETIAASSTIINDNQVTINLIDDLSLETWYYVTIEDNAFHDGSDNYFNGITDKTTWNFTTGNPMVLVFDTNKSSGTTIRSAHMDTVNVTVNWGDGNFESFNSMVHANHTYATEGIYTVSIIGTLTRYGTDYSTGIEKLIKVTSFGDIGLISLEEAFFLAINLLEVPQILPPTITNLKYMFLGATSFNQNISSWDVSNVTNMGASFSAATSFNQDIGNWDVSNVTNMSGLFSDVPSFNQDISNWNVSNVLYMSYMFAGATSFNQNIGSWNTSSLITTLKMFDRATSFDHDISSWDVSNVTDMRYMFRQAISFNQNIGSWDVSNVIRMDIMFRDATSFNQDIGNWNVSNVTNMDHMFYYASSFNQDIGSWNISNVSDMTNMFDGGALSTENYNSLLISWSLLNPNYNISFHGGNSRYSSNAVSAREHLISTYAWTITDAGIGDYNPIVSGNITHDGNNLADVTLTEGVITDEDGNYSITVSYGGNLTLIPEKEGYTFNPTSITYTSLTSNQTLDFIATENNPNSPTNGLPSGTGVMISTTELNWTAPVSGVTPTDYTVYLYSSDDNFATAIIDGSIVTNTTYSGLDLDYETMYRVKIFANYNPTKENPRGSSEALVWFFSTEDRPIYTVTGEIIFDEAPLNYVSIGGINTMMDATYSVDVIWNEDITLTPIKEGYAFEPVSLTYNSVTANIIDANFAASDTLAPVVTADEQNVNNNIGVVLLAQSNEATGDVYVIIETENPTTVEELNTIIVANKGAKTEVTEAYVDYEILVEGLNPGNYYAYAADKWDNVSIQGVNILVIADAASIEEENIPQVTKLYQNYPNPFNPVTSIKFDLAVDSKVKLVVYNSKGEMVKTLVNNEMKSAGRYSFEFNGNNLPSGIYYYELKAEGYIKRYKAMLVK